MTTKKIYKSEIISNVGICDSVNLMTLQNEELAHTLLPGQFLHVDCGSADFKILRRPISIFDCNKQQGVIKLLYKIIGKGTKALASLQTGDIVDMIAPLGNFFPLQTTNPLIIGGGIGIAPLRFLVRALNEKNIIPTLAFGFANQEQAKMAQLFTDTNSKMYICTDDGSYGEHGNSCSLATSLINEQEFDTIYSCGPEIMLANLPSISGITYVSLEAFMACGVGACLGCAVEKATGGYAHVCKDGPVFKREEVILHG